MNKPLDDTRDLTHSGDTSTPVTVPSHVSIPALAIRNPDERRAGLILLLLAFLSGCVLILPTLTAGPLVLDEYGTWWLAGHNNPLTLWERSLNYENIPPLSPFLHRLFLDGLGQSEAAFRLPSVVWFLLTIGVAWLLGRQLVGPVAGGLTALVVAWHPNALGEIRIARCYSLTLLLSSLLFWITLRWSAAADRGRYAVAWSVVAAALLWTHYLNLAVVLFCLLPLVWQFRIMPISARLALVAATITVAVSGIPLLSPLLRMSVWGESFGFQGETPIADIITPLWWLGFPVGWIAAWLLDRRWFRRTATDTMRVPRKHLRLLFLWGLLPSLLAAVICHGEFASLANPRYRIGFAGAAACLLTVAICRGRSARAATLGVVLAILVSWSVKPRYPWEFKRLGTDRSEQWKELAVYVGRHSRVEENLFVQSGLGEGHLVPALFDDPVFMDYAACRMGRFYLPALHPRHGLPFFWQVGAPVTQHFQAILSRISDSATPSLWVAAATDTDLNRASLKGFQALLASHQFQAIDQVEHSDCILLHYAYKPVP